MTLPDPMATNGAVALDIDARTATVMPAEPGYPTMLWQQGYRAMVRDPYSGPAVWAHGPGGREIARGQPEGGALRFTFRKGDPSWAEIVGMARLSAIVVVDRKAGTILGVKFRSRRAV